MRVLLLHNRYRLPGGEERAVEDIERLLRARGHQVERLERSSDGVSRPSAARGLLAGGLDPEEVTAAVRDMSADVVHAHNLHPLLGWHALEAAKAAGARTVLHLHNFRLFCAIGIAYRDGGPCYRCHGGNTLPGVRFRCRGSLGDAAVYAIALHRQQPRLIEHADRLIALSNATARRLQELGLPGHKTTVIPNFVRAEEDSDADKGEFVLAAGRLAAEKGFDTAIVAARTAGVPLVIAGSGPDEARLRALADGNVTFTGHLSSDALADLRNRAAVAVAPSRCEEQCPYAVLDALAAGVPVLASDRGGLPELVGPAAGLPADDPDAWAAALQELWSEPELRRARGRDGLARARERFGEDRYYEQLLAAYRDGQERP